MIHVCYCFCDKTGRYAKFAGTSMSSLLANTHSNITVHIIHDNTLTSDNREKFFYLAGRHNQIVKFYNVEELCPSKLAAIKKFFPKEEQLRVTIGVFYKLLIPQVLPATMNKVIFIDPDTIVNLDIKELWQTKLGDKALGVVTEESNGVRSGEYFVLCREGLVEGEDYFNVGVLLMNLNVLRGEEETIMNGIKFRSENPRIKFLEMPILNYCFSTRTLKLPRKFNRFVREERRAGIDKLEEKIYHYSNGASRNTLKMDDIFNRLWMDHFIKTPWFNEEAMARLYVQLQRSYNELKDRTLRTTIIMQGKTRAFFAEPKSMTSMVDIFSIRNDEETIPAENEDSIQDLIDAMNRNKGKSIFFIMTPKIQGKNFPFNRLTEAGFVEGTDFIKGWSYLPTIVQSYHIIQEM